MSNIKKALLEVDGNLEAATAKLFELISIPSVSSDPEGKPGIEKAARWLCDKLSSLGFDARVVETAGHPLVLAHSTDHTQADRPKLLFYGHYDVQPVGVVEDWRHPPFEPNVINEDGIRRFYGRGASDSKSQLWTFIEGLRAWKTVYGSFPGKVTILLEGEEESGSHSLPAFLKAHEDELSCDIAFICDGDMWSPTQPALNLRLKGLLHEKVTIFAPNRDLHSGYFGAVAVNPIRILSSILASIHDEAGRVTIEGFYDGLKEISQALRRQWSALSEETDLFGKVDLTGGMVEQGYSPLEAIWSRPTVDFNGITSGNQGPGERSVIPGSATVRLSFRLVEGQDPENIRQLFQRHVRSRLPEGCTVEFEGFPGSSAVTLPEDNPFVKATARGLEKEWGKPTVLKGSGGSIPVAQQFKDMLGIDCIVIGFILPDDAIHAPDERYDIKRLHKGVRSWIRILDEFQQA
ncbi:M20/M25/M40 family metallo-hydrolase [Mesorhizobium sp. BAC0120]|uniref:M20/M25/M40 family metallo-hydrolase n=1 Tax=Mesorhizobium sp. BAC0120 TaxID=3090670 RepID=UPI00298CE41B|nr:M20/M25/M40 family metallo-hydrolase [Mesorhizobium sp. BAC0120]MDW6023301.1 M20/M25/M40 family metallo-hydrolase [Mesorhizobium sp. BAC0120]